MNSKPSTPMATRIEEVLHDLDAGVFAEKIGAAISQTALNTCVHGKPGRVVIQFDMRRIGESSQVQLKHTLLYTHPTSSGAITEKDATTTPMHVGAGGILSLMPHDQGSLFGDTRKRSQAPTGEEA